MPMTIESLYAANASEQEFYPYNAYSNQARAPCAYESGGIAS